MSPSSVDSIDALPLDAVVVEVLKLDWVPIYFTKEDDNHFMCNVCQINIQATHEKDGALLEHMQKRHKEIYDLHKNNPNETLGFRIEFLHLPEEEEKKRAATVEIDSSKHQVVGMDEEVEFLLVKDGPKVKHTTPESRKRSWVWKYFEQLNSFIFRCMLCHVVLSIKGSNTNNMNRHVKSKHFDVYKMELTQSSYKRKDPQELTEVACEVEIPNVKGDELSASTPKKTSTGDVLPASAHKVIRRSWIWEYFSRLSPTIATCKLCNRKIVHGGNATGNMNRHLKFLHKDVYGTCFMETAREVSWVWKLFSTDDVNFYSCKICNFKCLKFKDGERAINFILNHLKDEHGVISGDQIISGTECESTDVDECTVAVDFLKGTEEM